MGDFEAFRIAFAILSATLINYSIHTFVSSSEFNIIFPFMSLTSLILLEIRFYRKIIDLIPNHNLLAFDTFDEKYS